MIEKLTTKVSINTQGEAIRFANECYEVAEEFAIGFAEWLMKTRFKSIENIPVEKLLEIYKQTL
jgi:hypothetical protein